MRNLLALPIFLLLCGCLKLGAAPLDFDCSAATLKPYWVDYKASPLVAEIQRDAAGDLEDRRAPAYLTQSISTQSIIKSAGGSDHSDPVKADEPIYAALMESANRLKFQESSAPKSVNVLLLSGGGGWGAFGAGFLKAYHEEVLKAKLNKNASPRFRDAPLRFDAITGVSTGALQALLVAVDDYDELEKQYRIENQEQLATRSGILGVLTRGSLFNTTPLRQRLEGLICAGPGNCPLLAKLAEPGRPKLFIGVVEIATGTLKIVNITALLQSVYLAADGTIAPNPDALKVDKAARCVAGVTLASTAIPVFLRPVRLGDAAAGAYTTYVDGGVRASVFEANTAQIAAQAQKDSQLPVVLYVIRNGPTVLRPGKLTPDTTRFAVDAKPDAGAVAMRSYSTIVNQSEVMSIAGLRLLHPDGDINVMTADGYRSLAQQKCVKTTGDDVMFDKDFMRCLVTWGEEKAARYPWIKLSPIKASVPPVRPGDR